MDLLDVLEREPHVRWTAYVLGVLAWSHGRLGHCDRALALGERATKLAHERSDASVSSFAHWSMAMVLSDAGDPKLAAEHARRSVEAAPTPADRMMAERGRRRAARARRFYRHPLLSHVRLISAHLAERNEASVPRHRLSIPSLFVCVISKASLRCPSMKSCTRR